MRILLAAACLMMLQGPALAGEKLLAFSMIDMDVEVHKGAAHLVDVSLGDGGRLQREERSVIPMADGGYSGVARHAFPDGSVTAVFQIQHHDQVYTGHYLILSGSGAYSGAHGQGDLTTLTGRDAAASSTGVYAVRLEVTTPDNRLAADQ